MTPAITMPLYLMIQLASGEVLPAQEMHASECLRVRDSINTSAKAETVSYAGYREMIVWAQCRPWPPLDCICGEEEGVTQ